jgi:hypothetical protein
MSEEKEKPKVEKLEELPKEEAELPPEQAEEAEGGATGILRDPQASRGTITWEG